MGVQLLAVKILDAGLRGRFSNAACLSRAHARVAAPPEAKLLYEGSWTYDGYEDIESPARSSVAPTDDASRHPDRGAALR